jgi:hypothetical protein
LCQICTENKRSLSLWEELLQLFFQTCPEDDQASFISAVLSKGDNTFTSVINKMKENGTNSSAQTITSRVLFIIIFIRILLRFQVPGMTRDDNKIGEALKTLLSLPDFHDPSSQIQDPLVHVCVTFLSRLSQHQSDVETEENSKIFDFINIFATSVGDDLDTLGNDSKEFVLDTILECLEFKTKHFDSYTLVFLQCILPALELIHILNGCDGEDQPGIDAMAKQSQFLEEVIESMPDTLDGISEGDKDGNQEVTEEGKKRKREGLEVSSPSHTKRIAKPEMAQQLESQTNKLVTFATNGNMWTQSQTQIPSYPRQLGTFPESEGDHFPSSVASDVLQHMSVSQVQERGIRPLRSELLQNQDQQLRAEQVLVHEASNGATSIPEIESLDRNVQNNDPQFIAKTIAHQISVQVQRLALLEVPLNDEETREVLLGAIKTLMDVAWRRC